MSSEMEKREKARRVWRLNKKEGIPVKEALSSVNLSKDVYYRLKRQREGDWEEEILLAENLQTQLSEIDESVEQLEERLEEIETGARQVHEMVEGMEKDTNWYDRLGKIEDRIEGMEHGIKELGFQLRHDHDIEVWFQMGPELKERVEGEKPPIRLSEVEKRVTKLEGRVRKIEGKAEAVGEELKSELSELKSFTRTKLADLEAKVDASGGLFG